MQTKRVERLLRLIQTLQSGRAVTIDEMAKILVDEYLDNKKPVMGMGQPQHTDSDPRAEPIHLKQEELGLNGVYLKMQRAIEKHFHAGLENKSANLASVIAANVGPGIEFMDTAFIADIVQNSFSDHDVAGITVHDLSGDLIYGLATDTEVDSIMKLCELGDSNPYKLTVIGGV